MASSCVTLSRPERRPFPAGDVLRAIAMEAELVAIVAVDMAQGVVIDERVKDRVLRAAGRINAGLDAAGLHHG